MNTVALSPGNGSQPAGEARSSRLTPLAAPIPTPQASSPSFRATQASNAGDCVPPLSLTRPALLGGSGGEPSIPSDHAGGAKMDGCNHPGRGPSGLIHSAKSSQAATSSPYQNVEPGTSWNEAYPFDPDLTAQKAMGIF